MANRIAGFSAALARSKKITDQMISELDAMLSARRQFSSLFEYFCVIIPYSRAYSALGSVTWSIILTFPSILHLTNSYGKLIRHLELVGSPLIGTLVADGHEQGSASNQLHNSFKMFIDEQASDYVTDGGNRPVSLLSEE